MFSLIIARNECTNESISLIKFGHFSMTPSKFKDPNSTIPPSLFGCENPRVIPRPKHQGSFIPMRKWQHEYGSTVLAMSWFVNASPEGAVGWHSIPSLWLIHYVAFHSYFQIFNMFVISAFDTCICIYIYTSFHNSPHISAMFICPRKSPRAPFPRWYHFVSGLSNPGVCSILMKFWK